MPFQAHNELVLERQLKVQRLVVPFLVVGSATSANVALTNDEPGFVYFRSAGNDQITPALDPNEVATYSASPVDSTGVANILVKLRNDYPLKVVSCHAHNRLTGAAYAVYLGSATGIATLNSLPYKDIMLSVTLGAINTSVTVDASLELEYVINENAQND